MIKTLVLILSVSLLFSCQKKREVDYVDSTIYRDIWGVPHVYGKSDADAVYGLAWASCEDDFVTIQEQMLAIKGKLGRLKGKDGVMADFGIYFMGLRSFALKHYNEISPKARTLIESYTEGLNAFARAHPKEVLIKDAFPLMPQDVVAGYMLGLVEISGAANDLQMILSGNISEKIKSNFPKGSNAIALQRKRTEESQTFIAINSHQPMEGWYSWYEAHIFSDDGLNVLGGTFPGGVTIFHGTNEHVAWAHTVNDADFSDVYKLKMHPTKKEFYQFDDEWLALKKDVIWAWMKLWGPIRIPIRRSIYHSRYGISFKTKEGYFAWRFVAGEAVKAIEQWYGMNKASNLSEFKNALEIQGVPCTNIVYADDQDNIFYISNGKFPGRSNKYNWKDVIPAVGEESLWQEPYQALSALPQVLNPSSGFVFNTNNTPYSSTDSLDNPMPNESQRNMGFPNAQMENNRSSRFKELIRLDKRWSYEEFKKLKFDRSYPAYLAQMRYKNMEMLLNLSESEYPDIKDQIRQLNLWNRDTHADNKDAALFILSRQELFKVIKNRLGSEDLIYVSPDECATAIRIAAEGMKIAYGTTNIALGEIQRHRRGDIDLPMAGGPDVLAAIYSKKDSDGKFKAYSGESYIAMVRFDTLRGPLIETINAYGASAEKSSPHFTDQMELFANQKLKQMTLNRDSVKLHAVSSYHPMR